MENEKECTLQDCVHCPFSDNCDTRDKLLEEAKEQAAEEIADEKRLRSIA